MPGIFAISKGKDIKFTEALERAGLDEGMVDQLIERSDLVTGMVGWLREQLTPAMFNLWTPPAEYVERIMARSESRGWDFTGKQADTLHQSLRDHAGPTALAAVQIWRGQNLAYNWAESLAWLKDEVEALGMEFVDYVGSLPVSFHPDSAQSGRRQLAACTLDITTYRDRTNGVVPNNVRPNRPSWPGLAVSDFLALNPQYCEVMDGEDNPFLMAAGLVVKSGNVPYFWRDGRQFRVYYCWADDSWYYTSVVARGE